MPVMTVVAGVNGAGKSSNIGKHQRYNYINPDTIAKEYAQKYPDGNPLRGMKEVLRRVDTNIKNKTDFALETTLAGRHILNQMQSAKKAGFEVHLTYVTLDSLDRHVERVNARVEKGGHDIPRQDIERRYRTSYENLPRAMKMADKVSIYDNTKELRPLLKMDRGNIRFESPDMPKPLKDQLYMKGKLTLRGKQGGREVSSDVTLRRFGNKSLFAQQHEAAGKLARQHGLNADKTHTRFTPQPQETPKLMQTQSLDKGLSR
jgi:predicted ABC-type ATPase